MGAFGPITWGKPPHKPLFMAKIASFKAFYLSFFTRLALIDNLIYSKKNISAFGKKYKNGSFRSILFKKKAIFGVKRQKVIFFL